MTMPKGSTTLDPMSTPWDRISKRVKLARPAEDQPDDHGQRSLARINELVPLRRLVEKEIDQEVVRAREQGASWTALGRMLLMSKQGAAHHWRIAVTNPCVAVPRTMGDLPTRHPTGLEPRP